MLINLWMIYSVVLKHFTDLPLSLKIHFKLYKAISAAQHGGSSDDASEDVTQAEDAWVVRCDEMFHRLLSGVVNCSNCFNCHRAQEGATETLKSCIFSVSLDRRNINNAFFELTKKFYKSLPDRRNVNLQLYCTFNMVNQYFSRK